MKLQKIATLLFLAIFIGTSPAFSQKLYAKKGDELNVFAVSGLNLRSAPDVKAKVVAKIAYAEKVLIIDPATDVYETIEGRPGSWLKVQYNNQVGFLFSGYLTKLKPPQVSPGQIDCSYFNEFPEWIKENLKNDTLIHSGNRVFKGHDPDAKDGVEAKWDFYSSGSWVCHYMGYEWEDYVFESFDITLNDILNFWDYYIPLWDKKCSNEGYFSTREVIFKKDESGHLYEIECYHPRHLSAKNSGGKIQIALSLWDL